MSSFEETGIKEVRTIACDLLLKQRVDSKIRGKRIQTSLHRLHVAQPNVRDPNARPPVIPPSVLAKQRALEAQIEAVSDQENDQEDPDHTMEEDTPIGAKQPKLEKDRMWELGGPGVYSSDWRKEYSLAKAEWAYDIIPEIVDGQNIADFVDPDIEEMLQNLRGL